MLKFDLPKDPDHIRFLPLIQEDLLSVEGKHFDSKFTAFPVFKLGATKNEYVGYGDTEIDALNKCLSLIKDKDRKTIMAPFGPDSRGATS